MPHTEDAQPLSLLKYPYQKLQPLGPDIRGNTTLSQDASPAEIAGSVLVWQLSPLRREWSPWLETVKGRNPGVALIVVLPPAHALDPSPSLFEIMESCRPQSVLPYHPCPTLEDLVTVLKRPPAALDVEVWDYLSWRGVRVDAETRRIIRRIFELSYEFRTINAVSRSIYLSRRALGRRFQTGGVPVPSHWLHFARILRCALRLQTSEASLLNIAYDLGYADGFALSNQMLRLTGVRPSKVRDCFGWEWFTEAWLQTEIASGGFSREIHAGLFQRQNGAKASIIPIRSGSRTGLSTASGGVDNSQRVAERLP